MNHPKRHTQAAFGNLLPSDGRDGRVGRDIADLSPLVDAAVAEFSAAVAHRRRGSTKPKAAAPSRPKAKPWEVPGQTAEEQQLAVECRLVQTDALIHEIFYN